MLTMRHSFRNICREEELVVIGILSMRNFIKTNPKYKQYRCVFIYTQGCTLLLNPRINNVMGKKHYRFLYEDLQIHNILKSR